MTTEYKTDTRLKSGTAAIVGKEYDRLGPTLARMVLHVIAAIVVFMWLSVVVIGFIPAMISALGSTFGSSYGGVASQNAVIWMITSLVAAGFISLGAYVVMKKIWSSHTKLVDKIAPRLLATDIAH